MKNSDHKHETERGIKVNVFTKSERAASEAFKHYDGVTSLEMNCPYCKADLWGEHVCYEHDLDSFEDTYSCDVCDVMVTLITPISAGEYHNVLLSQCEYLIEFQNFSGTPSSWEDEE